MSAFVQVPITFRLILLEQLLFNSDHKPIKRLKLVLSIATHFLQKKKKKRHPTGICSFQLFPVHYLTHARGLLLVCPTKGKAGALQEAHALFIASLPCKLRPGNVNIHCCIFIFCHGSAFSYKMDSGT